jgi:hypothetical protein
MLAVVEAVQIHQVVQVVLAVQAAVVEAQIMAMPHPITP